MRKQGLGLTDAMTVVLFATLLLASEARSEERARAAGAIIPGSRIRFLAPTVVQGPVQGTLLDVDGESVLISTGATSPFRVSRRAISTLEVSTGRRGNPKKGALIGGAIGAALGAGIGGAGSKEGPCYDDRSIICPAVKGGVGPAFGGAGAGAVVGAAWGALIGHLKKHDVWSPVPLEAVRLSLAPARSRGVGLALSVSW